MARVFWTTFLLWLDNRIQGSEQRLPNPNGQARLLPKWPCVTSCTESPYSLRSEESWKPRTIVFMFGSWKKLLFWGPALEKRLLLGGYCPSPGQWQLSRGGGAEKWWFLRRRRWGGESAGSGVSCKRRFLDWAARTQAVLLLKRERVGNRNTSGEDTVDSSSLEWLWNICLTGIIVLSPSGSLCSCLCSPVILSWQPKSAFKNRIQTMSLLCWVASQLTQWKLQSPQWPTSVTCRVTLDLAS